MKYTTLEIQEAFLYEKDLFIRAPKEVRVDLRETLALKETNELELDELCFLTLFAMDRMLGGLDKSETQRYLEGLELIGYPYELLVQIARGEDYPLAELATYLDEHKYEVYHLRSQANTLRSIDKTLKELLSMTFNSVKAYVEAEKVDNTIKIGSELRKIEKENTNMAERIKAQLEAKKNENS